MIFLEETDMICYISDAMKKLVILLSAALTMCGCEDFLGLVGGSGDDESEAIAAAYSVSEARLHAGESSVWVKGFIVGADLSSSKASFSPPFKSRTSIVIAADSLCAVRDSCMSVQLPSGNVRDSLNLADNPHLLGRRVYLKGDLVQAYYGLPGIKPATKYLLE